MLLRIMKTFSRRRAVALLTLLLQLAFKGSCEDDKIPQTNLVLIMFDDLRPELSIYGRSHMITPNFERLAKRSVVFDHAYAQIAVCNPSRDSMLTGLRPDTIGTYGFQSSFRPHLSLPTRMGKVGYNAAGYGKVFHWETDDGHIWNKGQWENKWYEYQNKERNFMNASTQPDKVHPEEWFRDYQFTTRAVQKLQEFAALPGQPFMLGMGFKLPHLAVHLPHKYYEMYKPKSDAWKLTKKELRFPFSSPPVAYRCCAEENFLYMEKEGEKRSKRSLKIGDINAPFTDDMHNELMLGYCGAITFVDKQLGRILDTMDALNLWNTTTFILTADHGMHNGEKGIWEKWSMFDESTRVPLLIHHPLSPYKGQRYPYPVELVDIFPTVNDIVRPPSFDMKKYCKPRLNQKMEAPYVYCPPLEGKSLAQVVLGDIWSNFMNQQKKRKRSSSSGISNMIFGRRLDESNNNNATALGKNGPYRLGSGQLSTLKLEVANLPTPLHLQNNRIDDPAANSLLSYVPVILEQTFAISQSWRCSPRAGAIANRNKANSGWKDGVPVPIKGTKRTSFWRDCDKTLNPPDQLSVMGYSIRTLEFRYTAWFHYNRLTALPLLDVAPFEEELYDHRGEVLQDFTHLETVNLVFKPGYDTVVPTLRQYLIEFIKKKVVFRGPFVGR